MIDKLLLAKLETYCAYTERCQWDVQQKCRKLEIPLPEIQEYMKMLEEGDFLSEQRYAETLVRSKAKRGWGPSKIRNALMQKNVKPIYYKQLLAGLDQEEQLIKIKELAEKKREKIKAKDEKDLKQKLIRFLMGKGYSFELIRKVL
jgi:regulatory protein